MSIIDTPYNTADKAQALAASGVRTVMRYYNFSNSRTFPEKCLTLAEAQALAAAGLQIGVVFQQRQNQVADFDKARGVAAGTRAYRYARDSIGQPAGSGIYFSVDFDATRSEITAAIKPFFEGVKAAMEEEAGGHHGYRIGVYGSGLVSSTLAGLGLIELTWLAMSRGFRGTREALAAGNYHLAQVPGEATLLGLDVDYNEANPQASDFGAFTIDPGDEPGHAATSPRYRVTARSGLRLRAGPGTDFDIIGSLAPGQIVHVVSSHNGWAQVDVQGDGLVDGFASEYFLARA